MTNQKVASIVESLQTFFHSADRKKAVLGLSGGIDSALTAKFAVMALGAENVTAIIMPTSRNTKSSCVEDAEAWAKELGIESQTISIDSYILLYSKLPWEASGLADMNIQARVRANILYHYANTHDALVLGTGNKTEMMLGYFTKYGDGACDCEVIASLYKTEVWETARELSLPEAIINKAPSAGLFEGQTDEEEIGMTYAEMDKILVGFESGIQPATEAGKKLWRRVQSNRHKTELPPTI